MRTTTFRDFFFFIELDRYRQLISTPGSSKAPLASLVREESNKVCEISYRNGVCFFRRTTDVRVLSGKGYVSFHCADSLALCTIVRPHCVMDISRQV